MYQGNGSSAAAISYNGTAHIVIINIKTVCCHLSLQYIPSEDDMREALS
jgi:hypothetical protein